MELRLTELLLCFLCAIESTLYIPYVHSEKYNSLIMRYSSHLHLYFFTLLLTLPLASIGSALSSRQYIPWSWQVAPNNPDGSTEFCPSTASVLGTFAIINVLVSIVSLVAGNQKVVTFLTCQCCDGDDDKTTWFYMFIFPLGLNLGSNALIAYLYKTTPGFGDTFTIWELTLFYTTRPWLSWLVLVVFMNIEAFYRKDSRYIKSTKAAVAAEIVLQFMSSYYMGKTANFAAEKGYYIHLGNVPWKASMMYSGALLSLISLLFTVISLIYILFSDAEVDNTLFAAILVSLTSWLGSWIFWSGFVTTAGHS